MGQSLVRFDSDAIQKKGYSLITPVVVTNGEEYGKLNVVKTGMTKQRETLMTLEK